MKKKLLVCMFIILILVLIFSVVFALIVVTNEKIIKGVSIQGVDISGLTKKEASEKLKKILEPNIEKTISLNEGNQTQVKEEKQNENIELQKINASQINGRYDYDKMTEEAYLLGRGENIFKNNFVIIKSFIKKITMDAKLLYNESMFEGLLNGVSSKIANRKEDYSYYIEDSNLVILKGKEGYVVEKDNLKKLIIEEINNYNGKNNIEIPKHIETPQSINIDLIYDEIYKEAKDAYINKDPFEVHSHIDGIDFAITKEEAKEIIEKEMEEYKIPLKITPANKKIQDLGEEAFPHELSKFTTKYDIANENRSNNLKLASDKINEQIVMPGEIFSFNKTVGQRTIALGYKEAAIYVNGRVEEGIGGGICQISSTLYNAALLANLEIISRSNHYFMPSYVEKGMDATVSWGTLDFKFKNSRTYPIKISCAVKNGFAIIVIDGIKEKNEFEVEIKTDVLKEIPFTVQYIVDESVPVGTEKIIREGRNGFTSQTYRILKRGGIEISRELLSKDLYNATSKVIAKASL